MTVHKSMRIKVPKNLIVDSANLELDEPVGQGTYILSFCMSMANSLKE